MKDSSSEKPGFFAQVYGYIVCLVAIITFLICVINLTLGIIDKTNPMQAGFNSYNAYSLVSFENYKLDYLKSLPSKEGQMANMPTDDVSIRKAYEAARQDKIDKVIFQSNRTIIVTTLLIIISIIMFVTHWRLARRTNKLSDL